VKEKIKKILKEADFKHDENDRKNASEGVKNE